MLRRRTEISAELQQRVFNIYITLLESERTYCTWLREMKELGDIHIKPLMRGILADRALQETILRHEDRRSAALLKAENPACALMRFPSKASNAYLGRMAEMAQQSRRFRRQNTM